MECKWFPLAANLYFNFIYFPKAHSFNPVFISKKENKKLLRMSKKHFLIIAALSAANYLFAQKDSTVKQLDPVVITATKFPIRQSQTGKVIIVIDKQELDKSIGKNLGQILSEQAGLTVNGSLNNMGTNQSIYMRGAGPGRTLITIDGVPVNDPSTIDNTFDINLIPLENIEQIEICKGAQSTLYGSDAVAGVINIIISKSTASKAFSATASFAGGNYGTYQGNAQIYGKLAKKIIYNIRYTRLSTDGFSSAYDSTGKNNFHHDGYHEDAITSNISWNATENFIIKSFFQYGQNKTDLAQSAFTDATNYMGTNKNLMLGGGFVYKLSSTSINGNYLYNTSSRLLLEDSTSTQAYLRDDYFGKTQYAEIFANSDLGYGFTLLNGADYRNASMNENGVSGTYKFGFQDTSVSQTSMYSSLFYSGKSGFNAELGGRLNTHSRYGSNYTYTFNPSFIINKNWKVYASAASGFKAPTLYQLYDSYSGNPKLNPEESVNYEGGFQFSSNVINTRITYFNRKINNGLDFNYFTYQYFNYNKEIDNGIEWENKIRITKKISLSANYTWLKAKEGSQSRITYNDTTYNYALRRPEHTVNITLGAEPIKQIYISVSGHYESRRYDIGGYDANFNPLPDATLNSFFIVNAYAEYKPKGFLKFFIDAKNIFNKKFFTIYGYNSIPAMFMAGATIKL